MLNSCSIGSCSCVWQLDLARVSFIFDDLGELRNMLKHLKDLKQPIEDEAGIFEFEVLRAKDRLSRTYDETYEAASSGGYRDVLLNGKLTWPHVDGSTRALVVEMQLHMRPLHNKKKSSHQICAHGA